MAELGRVPWWQWLPVFGWRIVANVESADEVPKRLPRAGAVLVGPAARPKWIVFDCPCRTGHRIMLTTDRVHSPHWTTTVKGRLTITPSIDYHTATLRCHYFIRNGRVKWT